MYLVQLPIAEHDLLDGIDGSDQISIGLATGLNASFYFYLERIQENPRRFATNSAGYRAAMLKRFTAVTFFCIDGGS